MSKFLAGLRRRWRSSDETAKAQAVLTAEIQALRQGLDDHRRETHAVQRLVEDLLQETRLLHRMTRQPPPDTWRLPPRPAGGEPGRDLLINSTLCRQQDFQQPWLPFWVDALGEPFRYHRKLWEHAFICQALWERDALKAGSRGLGFGCGSEPLTALFASRGCDILATDMSAGDAAAQGWIETAQFAAGKETLRRPALCPDDVFDRHVEFRTCDMNDVPADLTGFDFCWSACALEHLGSIEKGLAFIERSLACLKPGGWAVHTTEFNIGSNTHTVDHRDTVLFRRTDLSALVWSLLLKGHLVAPLDYEPGTGVLDRYVDVAPYSDEPSLALALEGFATTSFGLIIQRAPE